MMWLRKNWRFILLFLSLAGLLVLLILFRSFFIGNILRPMGLIFWLGWRVITSIHQSFYWLMVILISAALVLRMLSRDSSPVQVERKDDSAKVPNPYLDWLLAFKQSTTNRAALEILRQRLRELTTSSVGMTERMPAKETEAALQEMQPPISKESQAFLFSEKGIPQSFMGKLNLRIAFFLVSLRKGKTGRVPKVIHQPVDEILSLLEKKAKTHHES